MATEFVGIQLELLGEKEVRRDLEEIDNILNSFRGRKKFDAGLNEARKQVVAYKGELERLKRAQADTEKGSDAWNEYADKIDKCRQRLWEAQQAVREFGLASRAAGRTFMQTFNSVSSKVAHVGSAMQSFGNALTTLTSPFSRLTDGMIFGAGYKVLNQFTEGIENGFERADVMRKYPRIMQNLGYSAEEAQASIDKLDKSVLGLPTSLVDMVSMSQRFTSTLGDLTKGTDIAIAANNAFLASMSSEQQKYQGMMQLQDLIGGKDMNAREWYSLAGSMMPAIRMIGESLGYEGKELNEYISRVQQGKIANEEFLDALVKAGTDENGKIRQVALQSLDTWEAFFSRVKTAASKFMFKGILKPMNDLVKTVTGGKFESLNLFLDDLIYNRIDKMGQKVKGWINAHPEEITQFFKDITSINWGNFAKGFLKGLGTTVKLLELASKVMSKFGMTGFGWIMGAGRGIGKASTVLGGFLKGTRHIWAALFTFAKFGGKRLLGKIGAGGIFGKIASIFGKKKAIEEAGGAAKEIPTVASTFRSAFKSLEGLLKIGGAVAIASGTALAAVKTVKIVLNDLKDIGNLVSSGDIDWGSAAKAMGGFAAYLAAFASAGYVIGDISNLMGSTAGLGILKGEAVIGAITTFAATIAAADMRLIKDSFKSFRDITTYLSDSVTNLNGLKAFKKETSLERVKNVVDTMAEVYSSLKQTDSEGKSLMAASSQELGALETIIGGMKRILDNILPINETMTALSTANLISKDAAAEVGEKIGGMLEGLHTAFATFLGGDYGANPADISSSMASTIQNFNNALTALTGESGLFVNMRKVLNLTRSIPGVQNINSVMSSVKSWMVDEGGLFSQLKAITKGANDMGDTAAVETKMNNIANAFVSIEGIFDKLKSIKKAAGKGDKNGIIPGMRSVRSLISQLQSAFSPTAVGALNSDMSSFITNVESLLSSIEKINANEGNIEITIKLTDKIIGKKKVLEDIKDIDSDIKTALGKIKTYERNVNINLHPKVNIKGLQTAVTSGASAVSNIANSIHPATGGMVYRSGGGTIPRFTRRGTDTVPAMLTPGEYVHNRKAVSTFGIDFMRKVNSLDVKGAMNELMHRAGGMANINRGRSVINNYNNNQKVVINNNGNTGAGFTFKSASRFVGAF